jgi:hypothetical protein
MESNEYLYIYIEPKKIFLFLQGKLWKKKNICIVIG